MLKQTFSLAKINFCWRIISLDHKKASALRSFTHLKNVAILTYGITVTLLDL